MLTELKARLTLPTPAFWRKLRARALAAATTLGAATAGLAVLPQDHPIVKLGTYAIGGMTLMLVGAATVAALAVDDPSQLPDPNAPTNPQPL